MALVGTVLALGGTAILSVFVIGAVQHRAHREHVRHLQMVATENRPLIDETADILDRAKSELRDYRSANNNYLPDLQDGMLIAVQYQDAWERELFYEPVDDGCLIRSAGPDGEFYTGDDITAEIAGIPGPVPVQ